MNRRVILSLFALLVAFSLVGAPITMADWGEQATFSSERIEKSDIQGDTPLLQYDSLSNSAQDAVRRTIESPDGHYTVFGNEDRPDRFFYSDYAAPGQGLYAIAYEGQYYRFTTYASGGFPFVYWLYQLPFIIYGLILGGVSYTSLQGRTTARTAALTAVPGIAFHRLGPEFDFPLLTPMQFVGFGVLAVILVLIGLLWASLRETTIMAPN
ncbi:uncharacterized protein HHUB_4219 (plasmid) [Halobacterium hubeiense]|uniref:DUF7979 domain-containing protein n=1 Tax=Halobacterium hubeiense TaxID=1407499 RepID=A0A0U5H7P5_9EURY|nr:hypothetical protein [Halobacterium hubeiense]CQH63900.1 uncharacterized protein HHUB_4219 [Halobacterium hubeiense]